MSYDFDFTVTLPLLKNPINITLVSLYYLQMTVEVNKLSFLTKTNILFWPHMFYLALPTRCLDNKLTNFQNKCIIGQLRLLVNVWLFADSRALGHFGSVDGVVDDVDGVDGYGCVDAVDGVVGVDGVDDHGHQSGCYFSHIC